MNLNPNNPENRFYNQQLILMALSDGHWHRNMELKEKTKLTPRTLSKHLNELEKELSWIERRVDTESGEYPHPVLYKAKLSTVAYAIYVQSIFDNTDDIEADLKETEDPLQILIELHKLNLHYLTLILETIQKDKCISQKQLNWMTQLFLYTPYEIYTENLITAFTKAVQFGARFDIDQLRKNHNIENPP